MLLSIAEHTYIAVADGEGHSEFQFTITGEFFDVDPNFHCLHIFIFTEFYVF